MASFKIDQESSEFNPVSLTITISSKKEWSALLRVHQTAEYHGQSVVSYIDGYVVEREVEDFVEELFAAIHNFNEEP